MAQTRHQKAAPAVMDEKDKTHARVPPPKILRLGVIQAGKIIEEQLIRQRVNITIGASAKNTIVVPASSLPRSFVLFELQQGQYSLRFSDAINGRVSQGDQVLSLDEIRQQRLGITDTAVFQHSAQRKNSITILPLDDRSRGKVILGEITLLFQFVTPPPLQPRPQLPPSVRGSFFRNMDWVLASSFVALTVVHFGFLLFLRTLDIPHTIDADVMPDFPESILKASSVQAIDLNQLAKVGEHPVKRDSSPDPQVKGKAKKKRPRQRKTAMPCDQACQEARATAQRNKWGKEFANLGVLRLLGNRGKGAGATADLLASGDPGTDTEKAFSGISGLAVAARNRGPGGGLRSTRGNAVGRSVDIGELGGRVGGPKEVETGGTVKEKVPKAIVKIVVPPGGDLPPEDVGGVIRRGMGAIRSCYQRGIKRDPSLSGKILIRLSINTLGAVSRVDIEDDSLKDAQVASCIKSYAQRWRFPPPDGAAEVSVPFVFQTAR